MPHTDVQLGEKNLSALAMIRHKHATTAAAQADNAL